MAGKSDIVKGALDFTAKLLSGEGDEAAKAGIRAYHGSPHSFDKFSMSKLGTGEGAQAYGHGLYFADREGIAKSYRDALSPKNYLLNAPEPEISQKYGQDVLDMFSSHGGDPNELKDTINRLSEQNKRDLYDLGVSDVSQVKPQNDWGIEANLVNRADRLNRLQGLLVSPDVKINPGHMYEVNIDADPNAFLDWDKPLSNQPEAVRKFFPSVEEAKLLDAQMDKLSGDVLANPDDKALQAAWDAAYKNPKYRMARIVLNEANPKLGGKFASGNQVYAAVAQNPSEASALLKEAGIPGIKFLDAGSRSVGDGTRNYVVFDDKLISIVRKYGIAGASAMLGYNLMEQLDPKQALAATMADEEYRVGKAGGGSVREGYSGKGRVIGDVVDQALKLVMGSGDDAAKTAFANTRLKTPQGDPMRLYHMTPEDIFEFRASPENRSGPAVFLSPYPDYQPAYHQAAELNDLGKFTSTFKEGANVMPVYADVRNPLVLDHPRKIKEAAAKYQGGDLKFPRIISPEARSALEAEGYDGIVFGGDNPIPYGDRAMDARLGHQEARDEEFLVFDPKRIKSAVSNTGEYDFENPDITKAEGGSVREGYAGRGFVNDKNVEAALKYLRREFGNLPPAPVDEAFRLEGRKLIDKSRNFESGVPILGNERFGTPMSEMQAEYDQVRNLKDYLSKRPHDLVKENAVIYPAIGDLSAAGKRLTKVGDTPLVTPTDLHGGFEFSRDVFGSGDNPAGWASRQGAAKTMADRLSSRTNEGEVPYLSSYTMGPQAVDSTHMVANTIINMMPNAKVAAADIARFDAEMKRDYPGWPGIMKTQKALEFMNARNRPGTHLSDFAKKLDKKEYRASGFPDVGEIRFAVSEPRLLGVPAGSTGFSMMKVKPTAETSTEGIQHGTYTNKIQSPEGYSGGFENVTPSRIMFPEWFDKLHPNAKIDSQKAYQSAMTQFPKQKATNEWADNIEKYWAENPTPWGYAEGGSVEDEDSWFDSAMTIARNAADKATFGTAKYAAAGADYLTDAALDAVGYENDADFDRALAEQEYAMKEGEEKNPAAAGAGDVLGYVAPYLAIGPAEGALSTLGYLSDYGSKVGKTGSLFARALGYADGGEVEDDIYHAVRLSRDVGGATNENPQVMMTDANGVQYDATGKVIQTADPQANSNSSAAPSPTTPEEVGRRAAEDPATFDAMMERYAVPDRDIVDYEALKKEVSQQPQQVQQMTHVGAPPMRDIKVDMPLFGGEYNAGQAPYDIANPMSGVAQTAYDMKTVPLYFTPWTAPIGAGMDVAEGVATGDPLTASLAIGFGPGGKMAKAAGIGAANYFIDPSEAEAGPARWFSKAMEVASALPMEKMTGQQALAMLRKGVSPEELRWTGTDVFLSTTPKISKEELLDYLKNNRFQTEDVTLGGSRPTKREDVKPTPTASAPYMEEWNRLKAEDEKLNADFDLSDADKSVQGMEDFWKRQFEIDEQKDKLRSKMIDATIKEMGGLGLPVQYGPGSRFGDQYVTRGGEGYGEDLYKMPNAMKSYNLYVKQLREKYGEGGLGDMPLTVSERGTLDNLMEAAGDERKVYTSGHFPQYPGYLAHSRSQTLNVEPPGANRPYKAWNVEEAQSDLAKSGRKSGFYDPVDYQKWVNEHYANEKTIEKARDNLKAISDRVSGAIGPEPQSWRDPAWNEYHTRRQEALDANPEVMSARETLNNAVTRGAELDAAMPNTMASPVGPFVKSMEGWSKLTIKKQLDKALDSGADYFTWTPGEAQAQRYSLSKVADRITYNPPFVSASGNKYPGKIVALKNGSVVFEKKDVSPEKLPEFIGDELSSKLMKNREVVDAGMFSGLERYSVSGDELKFGGEGMRKYYDSAFVKYVQDVFKEATGEKPKIEIIEANTADGPRQQLGIRLTDEMREKARFSDFNRGGTVTAPSSYGNDDPAVSRAIALTREY